MGIGVQAFILHPANVWRGVESVSSYTKFTHQIAFFHHHNSPSFWIYYLASDDFLDRPRGCCGPV